MGGMDELLDSAEQEEVQEVADKLGVDDKEDLQQLDDRISDLYELLVSQDKKIEQLERRLDVQEELIRKLINDDEDTKTDNEQNTDDDGLSWE